MTSLVSKPSKILTYEGMNPHIREVEYAVRGELAIQAERIKDKLSKGESHSYDFDTVVNCNIGNPQQLQQRPITFFRQVYLIDQILQIRQKALMKIFLY
jgi:hypothetical protein